MRRHLSLPGTPAWPSAISVALLTGVALYVVLLLTDVGGTDYSGVRDVGFYNAMLVAAATFCLARAAFVTEMRLPWALVGLGLAAWVIGDLYYEVAFKNADEVPFPSVADAFYLAFYPPVYAGLALLLRSRLQDVRVDLWADGVIAGLTIAALGAALVFGVVVDTTGGDPLTVWTNLAYPVGDLGLIAVVTVVLAMTGWMVDRAWMCILLGCFVFGVADTAYLYTTAKGTYEEGSLLDAGWVAGIALVAIAAWQPRRPVVAMRVDGFSAFALPTFFGSVALVLLVYDHFRPLNTFALVLVTSALVAVIVRMALTFRRNAHLLESSRRDAETDALTGLANRRRLLLDLENRTEAGVPTILLLYDLDGFKSYNDAFGHPAGDALLHRLALRLSAAAEPYGCAYRMGGDEFCVIAEGNTFDRGRIVSETLRALRDSGEGFEIGSAYGAAILPDEATDLSEAMRIADTRLYGNKDSRRASAGRQTREVLLSVLNERDAGLRGHHSAVARLAQAVGEKLGLAEPELQDLNLAAELHDIGKLAIPDSILSKAGPLTEDEWVFVHRHTVIGERILSSAPALARVSQFVRSTHERMDGLGYPDGLAGEQVPILSRIVSVCDAFHAMVEARPYRPAMSEEHTLAELRRCSGSQFDPAVVEALVEVTREQGLQLVA
ncbi:MAG TPA: HD domain-containing phosphohydrolase [Gaiellaceae bacterium]|nr:HD domain-containing phosphohydrolase [Gaiellaceae bacterium]